MRNIPFIAFFFFLTLTCLSGQKVILDGYIYEKYNRGYLNEVKVTVLDKSGVFINEATSDEKGHFSIPVEANKDYELQFEKKVFVTAKEMISTVGKNEGDKVFIEHKMARQPGYLLEVTLAEKRDAPEIPVDAVNGSRIEIYNQTKKKEELVIEKSTSPTFSYTLQQGNEYSILIRKEGFFNKRLHANVNINGCYLCMDGFGTVNPGVVSNLTSAEDNQMGTLLANVELDRVDMNKNISIRNIYYALNSAELTDEAKKELDKVKVLLENNPSLIIELGSHTDSRGSDEANLKLSQARAQSAVGYITETGFIDESRLRAKGYGERKLVNKCEDGTPCNEAEHIQNRRTELKIVGFAQDGYAGKSLMEIIHQEDMNRFLRSGESDKVYADGAIQNNAPKPTPLPQPIKKNTPTAKPIPKPNGNNTPSVSAAKTGSIEPFDDDKPIVKTDAQPQPVVAVDRFEDETPNRPAKTVDAQKQIELDKPVVEKPVAIKPNRPTPIADANIVVNLKEVGAYSGYKVELFTAPKPLSANDPDLKMIAADGMPDVFFDTLKDGQTAYSVGYFQGWSETERFLEKVVYKYPNARIIEYFNGKRLGE